MKTVHIIGGGLAGCEAAWQALRLGAQVVLYEKRPAKLTPAHQTGDLAELVCSNSLKSLAEDSAPGLLKNEMLLFDSLVVRAAHRARVPAGQALAVDRQVFSHTIEAELSAHPHFERRAADLETLPTAAELAASGDMWIVATGPLTEPALAKHILELSAHPTDRLYFYDAIAPVLEADSIDQSIVFRADRYDKGEGDGDYLNIPLNAEEYQTFVTGILAAEKMPLHDFEEAKYFESCLPIEVMAERGPETLRFGPLKPVGLRDPRTGKTPHAVIQLRQENVAATMYSMVGFQTKMKWPEQRRLFSQLPGLSKAEFLRFGSVHRNTYFESPKILNGDLSLRTAPQVFLAGQITGVEGYTESAAIGLMAGIYAALKIKQQDAPDVPAAMVMGSLKQYVTAGNLGLFQPMNANFGLMPPPGNLPGRSSKGARRQLMVENARLAAQKFCQNYPHLTVEQTALAAPPYLTQAATFQVLPKTTDP